MEKKQGSFYHLSYSCVFFLSSTVRPVIFLHKDALQHLIFSAVPFLIKEKRRSPFAAFFQSSSHGHCCLCPHFCGSGNGVEYLFRLHRLHLPGARHVFWHRCL